ncbi:MAG: hypothetical protein IT170_03700 [Bryobacterales bacterium]|nr:hypothetical protein [Bryobacterales bacterium]
MMLNLSSKVARLVAPSAVCRIALAIIAFTSLGFAVDARLLSMLPAKSEAVAGIDVQAILNSGIAQEIMKSSPTGANSLAEFTAMTGVDVKKDIRSVIFGGYTQPNAKGAAKPGGAIGVGFITGSFDPARIGGAILSKGGTKQPYKGYTLYTPDSKTNKDGDVMTFLDEGTIIAGDPAQVKQVLDKAQGGLSAEILSRVNEVSSRYDIWMVSAASPAAMAGSLSGGQPGGDAGPGALAGDLFKKVESTQGGIKLGPTMNIGIEVNSTSPEDATALMNVLGFFRSMVGSQPAKEGQPGPPAGLTNMLNAIKMRTEAKTLFLTMDVPEADVISFLRSAQKRAAESKAEGAEPKAKTPEEITVVQ